MDDRPDVEVTSPRELRALFNERILPHVQSGDIVEVVLASNPASHRANQPPGTLSRTVGYFRHGRHVAEAHRYVLKDGSLGASGFPDPKLVVVDDVVLIVE